jgi:lysophospholipase L1-like esterase
MFGGTGCGIVPALLELTALSRGWPRIGLTILAVTLPIGCGIAVWGTQRHDLDATKSEAIKPKASAVPADAGAVSPAQVPLDRAAPTELPTKLLVYPAYVARPEDAEPAASPIENAERLDYYFGKLTLTELGRPGAITRAGHWGDSVIGGDGLTESIRRKLQERFGDAGHGFHIMGKYNRWYHHRGMRYEEVRPWDSCLIIYKCQRDTMRYGYGSVTSTSRGKALSRFQTVEKNPPPGIGDKISRFELWYQKRPDGGGFEIRVDDRVAKVVDTRAAAISDDVETIRVPDGEHSFEVAATGSGIARAYGVVMERDGPGVVWDELSMIGSFTQRLDFQDAEHLAAQIKRRDVDLMVFMLGGNDLSRENTDLKSNTDAYEREYARVIRKFRAGKPEAACLIMSTTDHAQHVGEAIVSRPIVARLVAAQRRVTQQEGCAFYDTYDAMGGAGTVERWRKANPPMAAPDLRHPTLVGQRFIGNSFYRALMQAYAGYRRRHEGQPLPVAPTAEP